MRRIFFSSIFKPKSDKKWKYILLINVSHNISKIDQFSFVNHVINQLLWRKLNLISLIEKRILWDHFEVISYNWDISRVINEEKQKHYYLLKKFEIILVKRKYVTRSDES